MSTPWPTSAPHARWLEAEGDRLLDFGRAGLHPAGGFAWLGESGVPDLERATELWVTARMTHVYALAQLMGRPYGALVDHGIAALRGLFRDAKNGGWYSEVVAGRPESRSKAAYGHAFVVLAASSGTAADRPGAADLLDEALSVLLEHFWDDNAGMVVEQWDEEFVTVDEYRGVNANMHTVEALLSAADVTGDTTLRERALRIVTRVVHELAAEHRWRIPEHYDSSWRPILDYNADDPAHPFRPFGATVGHWLEWARLAVHLHQSLGEAAPGWLVDDARSLFGAAVREGWSVDGSDGFVYTVDRHGTPRIRERMHWVAAEATAAAATLYAVTGDRSYADLYETWWTHIAEVFIDREQGSWHHELSPTNQPSSLVWHGKPDIYHAFQATLIPRLPPAPMLAAALRDGLLR